MNEMNCTRAQALLSAYIDSMTGPEEALCLEGHLALCAVCREQMQSLIALRNMIAQVEPVRPPEDLVLDTRVKLSHARYRNYLDWIDDRLNNVLKPLAVPALFGVSLTMLFFGVLFGSLVSNTTIMAQNLHRNPAIQEAVSDGNPQWNNPDVVELAGSNKSLDEALTIIADISSEGRVTDYNIITGRRSPAVDQYVKALLSLAQFTPATAFGKPVTSTIILTCVDVRG